jgi:acid stress-induced BolA-like protein IbaG/YrbA
MTLSEIKELIEKNIPNSTAHILDPMNDGQHLQAIVISPIFEGMMLVRQHQMVMKILKEALATSVHAMGLKTLTPKQWDLEKGNYGF